MEFRADLWTHGTNDDCYGIDTFLVHIERLPSVGRVSLDLKGGVNSLLEFKRVKFFVVPQQSCCANSGHATVMQYAVRL